MLGAIEAILLNIKIVLKGGGNPFIGFKICLEGTTVRPFFIVYIKTSWIKENNSAAVIRVENFWD